MTLNFAIPLAEEEWQVFREDILAPFEAETGIKVNGIQMENKDMESKLEDAESGFFFYAVRCDLVKIVDGREYTITSSYGSANTREGRNGRQSPFDGANSALKMAQKRALVSAALSLGCMSDSFTQDVESDTEDASAYFNAKNPEFPISPAQVKFFYAAAGRHGLTKQDAKALLKKYGYSSAKDILTKDFDPILEELEGADA